MHTLHLPSPTPLDEGLHPFPLGILAHSSVSSDFLTYLVFWLLLARSLPFRQTLDALNSWYLLPPPTLPEEPGSEAPLCPTFLLTWSQQDSPSKLKMLKELSDITAHSSGLLIPRKAENTEEHAALRQVTKKERGEIDLGKKYSLPQLNQLPWVKPDPFLAQFLWNMKDSIRFTKSTS